MPRVIPIHFTRRDGSHSATLAWATREDYQAVEAARTSFLHREELACFEALPTERRRRSYLLGRAAAKQALVAQTGINDAAGFAIVAGIFQQPIVRPGTPDPTGVTISHSERLACAVAFSERHPVAIDVEDIVEERLATMTSQILPDELAHAATAWATDVPHAAAIWTAKEALSKVLRCGMTVPFTLLAVHNLGRHADTFTGEFEHFRQYRFEARLVGPTVLCLVVPRLSAMRIDLSPLTHAAF